MTLWFSWRDLFRGNRADGRELPWPPPALEEPAEEEAERTLSPVAAPLHLKSGSALVRVQNGVIVVEREGEAAFERPIELVSAVHIHGWATITSPCVAQLLAQGAPVVWRSPTGYPIGASAPLHRSGLEARRAQYAAVGSAQGLAIARALVRAKVVNMRGLVRRRAALPGRACLGDLEQHARRAGTAPSLDTLLGVEGAATALYFSVWPEMISARAGELTLAGRTRRPPQDEVNALLSFAYAVLTGECLAACAAAGLDPRQGFLHRPRAGRPALALDLMEPFRPVIAEQAILTGLNHGQVKPEHFRANGHSVLLDEEGRKLALELIEQRFSQSISLEGRGEPLSWRQAIGLSARRLADALKSGEPFEPMERA
jgi:CRISPR-associated endonuclease Cas1